MWPLATDIGRTVLIEQNMTLQRLQQASIDHGVI